MEPKELERMRELEMAVRVFLSLARGTDSEPLRTVRSIMGAVDDMKQAVDDLDAVRRDPRLAAAKEGAWS